MTDEDLINKVKSGNVKILEKKAGDRTEKRHGSQKKQFDWFIKLLDPLEKQLH